MRQTLYDRQSTEYRTMTRNMLLIRTDSSPDCASSMTLHRMCHFPLVKERTFVVSSVTCRCRRNYSVAGLRRATVLSRYRKGSFFHAREVLWTRPLFFFFNGFVFRKHAHANTNGSLRCESFDCITISSTRPGSKPSPTTAYVRINQSLLL